MKDWEKRFIVYEKEKGLSIFEIFKQNKTKKGKNYFSEKIFSKSFFFNIGFLRFEVLIFFLKNHIRTKNFLACNISFFSAEILL